MKLFFKYCCHTIYLAILSCLMLFSCKKTDDGTISKVNIVINLQGVQDYVALDKIGDANKNNMASEESPVMHSYEYFDAITSFSFSDTNKKSTIQGVANSSISKIEGATIAAVPIPDNVKYRLLIYRGNQTVPEQNVVLVKGENPTFSLYINQTYRWVAYSFNEVNSVPDITNNVIAKAAISNKDFMYASDNITIAAGVNHLNMIFRRLTTLFEVNLNTRGMFGTIEGATSIKIYNGASNVVSQTADFNVLDGEFVDDTYEATTTSSMTDVTGNNIPTGMVKTAKIYSVGVPASIAANSLNIGLEPLAIKLHENTVRTFSSAKVGLTHPIINPQQGRKFTINATLIESAIGVVAGGTQWARSNLWYDATAVEGNRYRFRVSPHFRDLQNFRTLSNATVGMMPYSGYNKYYTDINDLWNYGAETPSGANVNKDPCNNVFPIGRWMMPSNANFQEIINLPNYLFLVNRNDARGGFGIDAGILGKVTLFNTERYELVAGWNRLNQNSIIDGYETNYTQSYTSGMNNLYFSGVGYRKSGNGEFEAISRPSTTNVLNAGLLGSNLADLGLLSGLSGGGFYWTNNKLASGNSYFNFAAINSSLVSLGLVNLLALHVLNLSNYTSALGENLESGSRLNIRCVRNPNFTP